jgi:WD40 repeat protein
MGSDGTNVHKVAHAEYPSAWLSWSPNGEIIRFSERNSLWEMSSNGSNLHNLLLGWHPSDWKLCGNWSPHGEYFFFRVGPESQIWALDERRGLFRKPSGLPIQMTSGPIRWGNPVPSKDGTKIFATGSIPRGELVRFESKSNQIQPFMGGVSADLVSFSRNGQTVAYVSFPDNILWKVNRDGSERVQLTDPPLSPEWISLSPDGTQVLFMATPESRSEAWIVSVQGGSPRRLLPEDGGQQTDPNWSPDGSKIVFATNRQDKPDRHSSIRILDVATQQVTNVPGSDGLFSPHWSPDGQSIAASTLDLSSLHIFDRETQRWSTIYKGLFAYANWSADSRFLYLFRYADDPAILRIPVKGGEPKVVVSLKDFKYTGTLGLWFGLDPTDAPLLLRDVGTSDVYALTLESK